METSSAALIDPTAHCDAILATSARSALDIRQQQQHRFSCLPPPPPPPPPHAGRVPNSGLCRPSGRASERDTFLILLSRADRLISSIAGRQRTRCPPSLLSRSPSRTFRMNERRRTVNYRGTVFRASTSFASAYFNIRLRRSRL